MNTFCLIVRLISTKYFDYTPDYIDIIRNLGTCIVLFGLLVQPRDVKWLAGGLTLALILIVFVAMFRAPYYGQFLRLIHYGGG